MAVLKAGSTLGSNTIFTVNDTEISSNVFTTVGGIAPTVTSGVSLFRHSNNTLQYGYLVIPLPVYQGENYAYTINGGGDTIQRFSFTSDAPASDLAEAVYDSSRGVQFSSPTRGYSGGGYKYDSTATPTENYPLGNIIKYYQFANGVDHSAGYFQSSQSRDSAATNSETDAYITGGRWMPPGPGANVNTMSRYNFSSAGTASDMGELSVASREDGAMQNESYGYTVGHPNNNVEKYPYSSDSPSTVLTGTTFPSPFTHPSPSNANSTTHGYILGRNDSSSSPSQWFYKFPFSAEDGYGSYLGTAGMIRLAASGHSSRTHGYASGGKEYVAPITFFSPRDDIRKYSFANENTHSDVGELSTPSTYAGPIGAMD